MYFACCFLLVLAIFHCHFSSQLLLTFSFSSLVPSLPGPFDLLQPRLSTSSLDSRVPRITSSKKLYVLYLLFFCSLLFCPIFDLFSFLFLLSIPLTDSATDTTTGSPQVRRSCGNRPHLPRHQSAYVFPPFSSLPFFNGFHNPSSLSTVHSEHVRFILSPSQAASTSKANTTATTLEVEPDSMSMPRPTHGRRTITCTAM